MKVSAADFGRKKPRRISAGLFRQPRKTWGRTLVISVPAFWLGLFFLAPFLIVLSISFAEYRLGIPPYTALASWVDGTYLDIRLSFAAFQGLFADSLYLNAYFSSLRIALLSTILTLLIGYPMAYAIARAPRTARIALLLAVMLPFWTSFLIRVYSWKAILETNGLLNDLLISLGIIDLLASLGVIDHPPTILHTEIAVYIGIVYSYLPFMILPLYATLEKMDVSLLEAALDLGCRPWKAFVFVTLPLSMPGIVAGCMLVFVPAVGEFVIPDLLGSDKTLMIGRVLWLEFFDNRDWPVASAASIAMLLLLVVPVFLFQRYRLAREEKDKETSR